MNRQMGVFCRGKNTAKGEKERTEKRVARKTHGEQRMKGAAEKQGIAELEKEKKSEKVGS